MKGYLPWSLVFGSLGLATANSIASDRYIKGDIQC